MTGPGQALRQNRIKISLWIAAAEGLLALVHVIPRWAIYVLAVVAVVVYVTSGRRYGSPTARNASWIFAVSQCAAVLVPVVWFVAKWLAITAMVAIAVVALIFLFMERDHTAKQ